MFSNWHEVQTSGTSTKIRKTFLKKRKLSKTIEALIWKQHKRFLKKRITGCGTKKNSKNDNHWLKSVTRRWLSEKEKKPQQKQNDKRNLSPFDHPWKVK